MEDKIKGRKHQWKTTQMEDKLNGRQSRLNGRRPQLKTTSIEEDFNVEE